jgi:hypothetical protein
VGREHSRRPRRFAVFVLKCAAISLVAAWQRIAIAAPMISVDAAAVCTKYAPPPTRWKGEVAVMLSGLKDARWRGDLPSLSALNLRASRYISQPWVLDGVVSSSIKRNDKLAGVSGLPWLQGGCLPEGMSAAMPHEVSPPTVVAANVVYVDAEVVSSLSASPVAEVAAVVDAPLSVPTAEVSALPVSVDAPVLPLAMPVGVALDGVNVCTKYAPPPTRWKGEVAVMLSGLKDARWNRGALPSVPALNMRASRYIAQPWVLDGATPSSIKRNDKLAGVAGLPLLSTGCLPVVAQSGGAKLLASHPALPVVEALPVVAVPLSASPQRVVAKAKRKNPANSSVPLSVAKVDSPVYLSAVPEGVVLPEPSEFSAPVEAGKMPALPLLAEDALVLPVVAAPKLAALPVVAQVEVVPVVVQKTVPVAQEKEVVVSAASVMPAAIPVKPVTAKAGKIKLAKKEKKSKTKVAKSKAVLAAPVFLSTAPDSASMAQIATEVKPAVLKQVEAEVTRVAAEDCSTQYMPVPQRWRNLPESVAWVSGASVEQTGGEGEVDLRSSQPVDEVWRKTVRGAAGYAGDSTLVDEFGASRISYSCFPAVLAFAQDDGPVETAVLVDTGAVDAASYEKYAPKIAVKKYGLAPILWRGRVGEVLTASKNLTPLASKVTGITNAQFLDLEVMTYVIQPWVATITGGLGFVTSSSYAGSSAARNNGVSGKGRISVVPQSRFPLSVDYNMGDGRSIASGYELDAANKSLSITQRYRPLRGSDAYRVGYTHSINDTSTLTRRQGSSSRTVWTGSYTTRLGEGMNAKPLAVNGRYSVSSPSGGGSTNSNISLTATHTYLPEDSLLSLHFYGSLMDNAQSYQKTGTNFYQNAQLTVDGTWQPEEEDNPLVVVGKLKVFRNSTGTAPVGGGGTSNQIYGLNLSLGATYNAWKNWSVSGNASAAMTQQAGVWALATTQSATAAYQPPSTRIWRDGGYNWFARGTVANSTNGAQMSQSLSASAGQRVKKNLTFMLLGKKANVSLNAAQTVDGGTSSTGLSSANLTHSASLAWSPGLSDNVRERTKVAGANASAGLRGNARLRMTLAMVDRMSLLGNGGRTQSVTFSVGSDANASGFSTLSAAGNGATGDFSVQFNRQMRGGLSASAVATVGYGYGYKYKYRKRRAFGVRGLDYNLNFAAGFGVTATDVVALNSTSQSQGRSTNFSLSQVLTYKIGQNDLRFISSFENLSGVKRAGIFLQLRAWRDFGNSK